MLQLVVDKRQNLRDFTDNTYAQGSFYFDTLIKNKDIKVNGQRVGKNVLLEVGDVVTYYTTPKQESRAAFYITYEDENVLVVDKESGVNSEAVFAALCRERECYFIHRLDRNTKGLMIFALSTAAESVLLQAFREKRVEKRYHALCFRVPKLPSAVLTAYLKKDEKRALVQVFDSPQKGAEKIVTEYTTLETGEGVCKLEICLHTGKTHQIRAHLAHIGCPIVGDMKYGDEIKNKERQITRQCLIAKKLRIDSDGILAYLKDKTFLSAFEL
ncbi:MAG: RluA family pseudouridine synthase [Clostridia bacterium]|nr:RluA family pseudouridine synthase [Clostridia bacterium]